MVRHRSTWRWLGLTALAVVAGACAHLRPTGAPVSFRVMTYNIAAGFGDLERTAATIKASSPDLVALLEVDVHWSERSHFADEAAVLSDRLGMQVRFARIYQIPGTDSAAPPREFGVALLSRFSIVDFSNHEITRLSTQQPNPVPAPAPGFLEAKIDIGGVKVRVFNTHLDYRSDPRVREQQVADMLGYIGNSSEPTLLFGDLNAPPDAGELRPLLARLRDAWPASEGTGYTYPAEAPVRRIDYVLTSRDFRVKSASVPAATASDHRPVVVDLEIRAPRL